MHTEHTATLHLPAPTVWPMVLGLGITMIAAGLVTNGTISLLGLVLSSMAAVGWFRNVLPHEKHEQITVTVSAQARNACADRSGSSRSAPGSARASAASA